MIELVGGRLVRWDSGRRVRVGAPEAHFAHAGDAEALVTLPDGSGEAEVPNALLQRAGWLDVWEVDGARTVGRGRLYVEDRARPSDYVYTETEAETANRRLDAVEAARVTEAEAETLPPGSEATARIEQRDGHAALLLGVPRGDPGGGGGPGGPCAVPSIGPDGSLSWAWGEPGELPAPVRVVQPGASIGEGEPFAAAPEGSSYINSDDYGLWAYVETGE